MIDSCICDKKAHFDGFVKIAGNYVTDDSKQFPLIGVGVVVWRDSKFLLIKRGKEPRKGQWSLPGGKQQFGETLREASLREVEEETGLTVTLTNLIDVVDSITAGEHGSTLFHYTLIIFCSESTQRDVPVKPK